MENFGALSLISQKFLTLHFSLREGMGHYALIMLRMINKKDWIWDMYAKNDFYSNISIQNDIKF